MASGHWSCQFASAFTKVRLPAACLFLPWPGQVGKDDLANPPAGLFLLGLEFHLPTAPPFLPTTRSHRSQVRGTDLSRPPHLGKPGPRFMHLLPITSDGGGR